MQLGNNQLVSIFLSGIRNTSGSLLPPVSLSFTTILTPLLTSPMKIREIAGAYLVDISDDVLNQLILKYSIEANTIALCDTTQWDKWDFYAEKWIAYKVAIDSIYNSPTYLGEIGGKQYKKLGDFALSIDNSSSSGGAAKSFLKKLECEVFKLETSVRNCRDPLLSCDESLASESAYIPKPSQNVVKGANFSRPVIGRTFMKDGEHPQWTGYIKQYNKYYQTNKRG